MTHLDFYSITGSITCMDNHQSTFKDIVNNLISISDEERQLLLKSFKKMDKERLRSDFKLKRIEKDKTITNNILQATIEDLAKKQKELVELNTLLSEQKSLIEEKSKTFEENLQKLERSYKELEQFSYIASHDLKSPLRTISSFAQLLKRRYYNKIDQDANEFIEFIVSGIQQMDNVIRNSLEYAKVGQTHDVFEKTDLNTVLNLVQLNLKDEIQHNQAIINIPKPLPSISANKTSILQLFQNLVSNAIKFRREDAPIITITYQKGCKNFYEFRVSDNGIGIAPEYAKKAFMPFKRIGKSKPGQGIGLAICKKVVENHSGTINFISELHKGTTFIFSLPMLKESLEMSV